MRVRSLLLLSSLAVAPVLLVSEEPAHACGGCVAPPGPFTAVSSHRMVIKVGVEETILWDQFTYTGAPEEFAWILPVPSADAVVELAEAAFVDVLDEETAPIVQAPAFPCADSSTGGCGAGEGVSGPISAGPVDGVDVVKRQVVGPYETVLLDSQDSGALYTWLGINGYAFPDAGIPVLDDYIARDSHFIVLRLRPGAEVSAMMPVRVRFKGFMGQFPLEMVTLGASGQLELSLWVVAEQRYAPSNYPNTVVSEDRLVWNWETSTSNYDEAFDSAIEDAGGRAWITEYARVLDASPLAARLAEDAAEDHAVLTANLHYPVVTRLRTRMLVDHLDEDLWLGPAEDSSERSREIIAGHSIGAECSAEATSWMAPTENPTNLQTGLWLGAALCLLGITRRRRRLHLARAV